MGGRETWRSFWRFVIRAPRVAVGRQDTPLGELCRCARVPCHTVHACFAIAYQVHSYAKRERLTAVTMDRIGWAAVTVLLTSDGGSGYGRR